MQMSISDTEIGKDTLGSLGAKFTIPVSLA